MYEFVYESEKHVHVEPFLEFTDALELDFSKSNIYKALSETTYIKVDGEGKEIKRDSCDLSDHHGLRFLNLKGDYDYLLRWYHNPYRSANTRHGSYIMLYLIDGVYRWKLSQSFFTKIMTIPDNISDLFDFG